MSEQWLFGFEHAKAQIGQILLAAAEARYRATEEQAKAEYAWTAYPYVDRNWWGWIGGRQFGPVEFVQLLALIRDGQLKPGDFIRNGLYGQHVPSANVPGLFSAAAIMARASEALQTAKLNVQSVAQVAPPPSLHTQPAPDAVDVPDVIQWPLLLGVHAAHASSAHSAPRIHVVDGYQVSSLERGTSEKGSTSHPRTAAKTRVLAVGALLLGIALGGWYYSPGAPPATPQASQPASQIGVKHAKSEPATSVSRN